MNKMGFNHILPVTIESFYDGQNWSSLTVQSDKVTVDSHNRALHYGQSIFEGIKIFRFGNDLKVFRLKEHLERLNYSAHRLAMAEIDVDEYVDSLVKSLKFLKSEDIMAADFDYIYVRPLIIAMDSGYGVKPSKTYKLQITFCLLKEMEYPNANAWVEKQIARSHEGGTGDVKFSGNYASSFAIDNKSRRHGCDTTLWMDINKGVIEEFSSMNVFFYHEKNKEWITPKLTGKFLAGITRKTFAEFIEAKEKTISWKKLKKMLVKKEITKIIGTGTAVGFRVMNSLNTDKNKYKVSNDNIKELLKIYFKWIKSQERFWTNI